MPEDMQRPGSGKLRTSLVLDDGRAQKVSRRQFMNAATLAIAAYPRSEKRWAAESHSDFKGAYTFKKGNTLTTTGVANQDLTPTTEDASVIKHEAMLTNDEVLLIKEEASLTDEESLAIEEELVVKSISAGELNVAYIEFGASRDKVVILLHGWPYDVYSFEEAGRLLAKAGYRVIVPFLRGYGPTRFLSEDTFRNGQQSVFAVDTIALMDALKIRSAIVGGFDWGARAANVIAALWPDRCKALVSVSGYLIGNATTGKLPLPPSSELAWWYMFYFATERGRAGYEQHRHEFARLIWRSASPKWNFDEATFARTAESFNNPDHIAIVVHNYRWRLGMERGDSRHDELERILATNPVITVPAITLEGDANGAPHPDPGGYAAKYTGKYKHVLLSNIGHNLPQEAPRAFADAVMEVDRY